MVKVCFDYGHGGRDSGVVYKVLWHYVGLKTGELRLLTSISSDRLECLQF